MQQMALLEERSRDETVIDPRAAGDGLGLAERNEHGGVLRRPTEQSKAVAVTASIVIPRMF